MSDLLPSGAWDTHIHVLDPGRYPYVAPRHCTPAPASLASYAATAGSCSNIVIAHASMQGASRTTLLEALSHAPALGQKVRVVLGIDDFPEDISDADLDALHVAGVRGVRLFLTEWNTAPDAVAGAARKLGSTIMRLGARFARLGWVIAVITMPGVWAKLADLLRGLDPRVKVLADHLAWVFPGGEKADEFPILLQLMKEGRLFVKLSAFDRVYGDEGTIEDLELIVKAFVAANPDRILYGSDWPHCAIGKPITSNDEPSEFEDFRDISDEGHIRKLREWIPDDGTWQKLFVINPDSVF